MDKINESDVLFGGTQKLESNKTNKTIYKTFEEMENKLDGKKVLVLGGYSELGYDNYDELKNVISSHLAEEVQRYGKENLAIVSCATSQGIGMAYDIAKGMGLETYGIVSSSGRYYPTANGCDNIFYVERPKDDWATIDENGDSYLVRCAAKNGKMVFFGGGQGTLNEIKEATEKGIEVDLHAKFYPNKACVKNKLEKLSDEEKVQFDPTPVLNYVRNEKKKKFEDEMIKGHQDILMEKDDMKSGCYTMGFLGGIGGAAAGLVLGLGTGGIAFMALGVSALVAAKLWNNHKDYFENKEAAYLEKNAYDIPSLNTALDKINKVRNKAVNINPDFEVPERGRSFPLA